MSFKLNYFLIPLLVFAVLSLCSLIIQPHLAWYHQDLLLPELTPPARVFSVAWNIIGIFTAAYLLLVWNTFPRDALWYTLLALMFMNAFFNISWVWVFFDLQALYGAYWLAFMLELNLFILMVLTIWRSWATAFLLLPYTIWVGFAIYLNYEIYTLNVLV